MSSSNASKNESRLTVNNNKKKLTLRYPTSISLASYRLLYLILAKKAFGDDEANASPLVLGLVPKLPRDV